MKIKKYEAVDMEDALRLIKNDLGSDAVILSTRNIKKGGLKFGLFSRQLVEVTAAVDEKVSNNLSFKRVNRFNQFSDSNLILDPLYRELGEMKDMLNSISESKNGCGFPVECQKIKEELNYFNKMICPVLEKKGIYSQNIKELYKEIILNGINERLALELIDKTNKMCPKSKLENKKYLESCLAKIMMDMLKVSGSIKLEENNRKIVVLVGPTGVGKTTTIAKIASIYSMLKKKKVVLATVDTYRVGAIEQLKMYAKIIKIPVDIISSMKNFKDFVNRYKDKDLILIDTVGRGYQDSAHLNELKSLFNNGISLETHLALSITTKDNDLSNIINKFSAIPIDRLLFTKLDESTNFGSIFNHSINANIPISYLTTGQKIPEDIEVAVPERIVDLILNLSKN